MNHTEEYYYNNSNYSEFLDKQSIEAFTKYVDIVGKYLPTSKSAFLDVGCGTGIAISLLSNKVPNSDIKGIEINKTSVNIAKEKGLNVEIYNGTNIPFGDITFDVVGSNNVIEHVDDVENFLKENLRVLKPGGYVVIACPNFLSISNNYHWHTTGAAQKIKNILGLIARFIRGEPNFMKMKTIQREIFQPDDDACNVINPIDILNWAMKNKLERVYWSSQLLYTDSSIINFIDKTPLKAFFGACLFVFKKPL